MFESEPATIQGSVVDLRKLPVEPALRTRLTTETIMQ